MTTVRRRVVYIAGPFRAENGWEVEQNVRRAERVALELWKMGAAVICPHTNTRFFSGAAPDDVWLNGDLEILRRCDAIVLIPGWRDSAGTREERTWAYAYDLPMFEWPTDAGRLQAWIAEVAEPLDRVKVGG